MTKCARHGGYAVVLSALLAAASEAQVKPVLKPYLNQSTGATLSLLQPGPAPANLSATGTPAMASLRWDPAAGATGYSVSRTDPAGTTVLLTATPLTLTTFDDQSGAVKSGLTYTYRVSASYSNYGDGTATVYFTPPAPAVPAWVRVEIQSTGTALVWGSVAGAAWYQVIETWSQPIYKTVYGPDGKPTTQLVGYQTQSTNYTLPAPQTSLRLTVLVSGHRFDVGAAYAPTGITAPRQQWPGVVLP